MVVIKEPRSGIVCDRAELIRALLMMKEHRQDDIDIDLHMMQNPILWPLDVLPLTRRVPGADIECAYLCAGNPVVTRGNVIARQLGFDTEPNAGEKIEYASWIALQLDGWRVN